MDQTIFTYAKIRPTVDLVEEVFSFDFNKFDGLSGAMISKYCAALAQYLVYMRYQRNKLKMDMFKVKQDIERIVFQLLDKETLKRFKTKTDAKEYLISNNKTLSKMRGTLDKLNFELIMSDGMDKSVLELINALKRELTRRSEEMDAVRLNRK